MQLRRHDKLVSYNYEEKIIIAQHVVVLRNQTSYPSLTSQKENVLLIVQVQNGPSLKFLCDCYVKGQLPAECTMDILPTYLAGIPFSR